MIFCADYREMKQMYYTPEQIKELAKRGELWKFYKSYEWRRLALEIIADAHHECAMCKQVNKLTRATTAHHIKYLKVSPELAYERSNLMPLCHDCHDKIHGRGAYAKPKGFTHEEKW